MRFPTALNKLFKGEYMRRKTWKTSRDTTNNLVFYVPDNLVNPKFNNNKCRTIDTEYDVINTNLPLGTFCYTYERLGVYSIKTGFAYEWTPMRSDILGKDWEVVKNFRPPLYKWKKPVYFIYDINHNLMYKNTILGKWIPKQNNFTEMEKKIMNIPSVLTLRNSGKVRDIFNVNINGTELDPHILISTSDRVSAFDVVLKDKLLTKGEILNQLSLFWFGMMENIIPNHITYKSSGLNIWEYLSSDAKNFYKHRAIFVRLYKPLPVEAIVRGYIIGSGWKDYQKTGMICGHTLPEGLQQAEKLPESLFTPSTKADIGEHDENISFERMCEILDDEMLAEQVRDVSLKIFNKASEFALKKGIIIADTKLEFGLDDEGKLILIDELLTPDSSRFWGIDEYKVGISPPSFDKQIIRDWISTNNISIEELSKIDLPDEIKELTMAKYKTISKIFQS